MAFRWLFPIVFLLGLSFNFNQAKAANIYQTVYFDYHAKGGFWAKTLKEMSSDEVKIAANTACTYYTGVPCPEIADTSQEIKRSLFHNITNNGPNEFSGGIKAPEGSKICRATVVSYKLSQHATFNGTIQRALIGPKVVDKNGQLAYYAFVAGTAHGADEILATVVFQIIPEDDQRSGCLHNGSAWLCGEKAFKSHECTAVQPGVFK